jgi:hypothetical protein
MALASSPNTQIPKVRITPPLRSLPLSITIPGRVVQKAERLDELLRLAHDPYFTCSNS